MQEELIGGLDFGTSGVRISVINSQKELKFTNSVPYQYGFKNPNSWRNSCENLLDSLPSNIKSKMVKLAISGTSGTLLACNFRGDPLGRRNTLLPCMSK